MVRHIAHHHHLVQLFAVRSVIRTEDLQFEGIVGHLFVKDSLCIKSTVIVANPRVISTHDKMGTATVLTEHRVQHSLTGSGIQHIETVSCHHDCIWGKIDLDHLAYGGIADVRGNIAWLEFAQQHVDQHAVCIQLLHRHAAQLLVRAVHGVAGLECHHLVPAVLGNLVADFHGGTEGIGKVSLEVGEVQYLNRTGQQGTAKATEGRHARVFFIQGPKDFFRHEVDLLIADRLHRFNIHNGQHRVTLYIGVAQGNAAARFHTGFIGHIDHWYREEQAVYRVHFFRHAKGIRQVHIASQWVKITAAQHHGVGRRRRVDQNGRQVFCLGYQRMALLGVIDKKRV